MNAIATLPPEVAAYLDQVRAALADVPADERDEMLADLEVSLLEGATDSAEPPEARLGPPERFAQELRAAAGIETAPAPGLASAGLRDHLRALLRNPRVQAGRATALELAPVWWVARGYFAACVVALFGGFNWSERIPLVPVRGLPQLGLALILAGVIASVWLGLRTRRGRGGGKALLALNVAVALAALPVLTQIADGRASLPAAASEVYFEPAAAPEGVAVDGLAVRNIYPYSRDGELLLDVLLYDENGRPLTVGNRDMQQDPLRRYLFTVRGKPLLNSFPIRYMEPGSTRVKRPLAAPKDLRVPEIETPPLKVKRP